MCLCYLYDLLNYQFQIENLSIIPFAEELVRFDCSSCPSKAQVGGQLRPTNVIN